MTIVRKVEASAEVSDDLTFVLSDATVDRYGDTIEADGWDLRWFRRNPIALFNHNSDFPIGIWKDARVEGGKLKARLSLASKGTSARIDELISLVEQGILRATSVGFKPIEAEPREGGRGVSYKKQELLETSLVSVPANPAALQVARSMHISDDVMRLAFGEHAGTGEGRGRGTSGEHAASPPPTKAKGMTLSDKIQAAQETVNQRTDALRDIASKDFHDLDAAERATEDLTEAKNTLASLVAMEKALGETAQPAASAPIVRSPSAAPIVPAEPRRPFSIPTKERRPGDYVLRGAVIAALHHVTKAPVEYLMQNRYGDDPATRVLVGAVTKAATTMATTTAAGWAAELVQTSVADFMETLVPDSVYNRLAAAGTRLDFGGFGSVSIPSRATGTSVAGAFVGEGSPIPVRQAATTSVTLTPKKMAVISSFTRELAERSTPAIEAFLRNAIQEDTTGAIDAVLLDATAASTIRPAGLRNGVAALTGTAGANLAAVDADVIAMVQALITATGNNVRAPVWIMNPVSALRASLFRNAGGDYAFRDEIRGGNFMGFPLITSSTVPAGTVMLVDAADFVTATGDAPRFDVSDQATLHFEDTTPLAIGTAGAPATVAAPTRSLFQHDSLALRMILPISWAFRRTGMIAYTTTATW